MLYLHWSLVSDMRIFIMLLVFAGNAYGEGGVIVDQVVRVVDGRTIEVNVGVWPDLFGAGIRVRMRGIYTPKLRGTCLKEKSLARKAKWFTYDAVSGETRVALVDLGRGSFFGVVARVLVNGKDLGEMLVAEGLARKHGRKMSKMGLVGWC